jgi:hypothetical protein
MEAALIWDPHWGRYRDATTRRLLSHAQQTALRNDLADTFTARFQTLATQALDGEITSGAFGRLFRQLLAEAITGGYAFGAGGVLDTLDADRVTRILATQESFAAAFIEDVAAVMDGPSTEARLAWRGRLIARAGLYAGPVVEGYERGTARAAGRVAAELASDATTTVLSSTGPDLPAYPGDGQTSCVVSPESRVLTDQGWTPIKDVHIGDRVLTHEGRFRRVTATMVNPAKDKTFMTIVGTTGETVTFTGDHQLLSPHGWYPVDGIIDQGMLVLMFARGALPNAEENDLRVRREEGSSGEAVHQMRQSRAGHEAVAGPGHSRLHDDRNEAHAGEAEEAVRRHQRSDKMAAQSRWAFLRVVLGGRPQANHLSLSMAMDQGTRANSGWARYSPQEPGLHQRRLGQPGVLASPAASATTSSGARPVCPRSAGRRPHRRSRSSLRAMWWHLSDRRPEKGQSLLLAILSDCVDADNLPMRRLRKALYRRARTWQAPQVLQQGLLPDGVPLYDITVEGDHSFVIEGIAAHNCLSRCRCSWKILAHEDRWECWWKLNPAAEHCEECVANARRYDPLIHPWVGV